MNLSSVDLDTRSFYKKHFYKQHQTEIDKKIKQKLCNILRPNFCYLQIICLLHPRYRKKNRTYSKKMYKKTIVSVLMNYMINYNENENEKQIRPRHELRPRPRHGFKYSKYKKCLSLMMLICIKQHLNNI